MNSPFLPLFDPGDERLDWMADALCAQTARGDEWFDEDIKVQNWAKAVCGLCDVRAQCLEFALRSGQRFGVWGGVPASSFASLRADRGISLPRQVAPHGTAARYKQHYRDNEFPCERCRVAERRRRDDLRERKRMSS
jgi:WhiB family redox-sensing transcriptional regulator